LEKLMANVAVHIRICRHPAGYGEGASRDAPQCGQLLAGRSFGPLGAKPLARCPNIPPMFRAHLGHGNRIANAAHATSITAATPSVSRRASWFNGSNGGRAKPRKTTAHRTAFDQNMRRLSRSRIVSATSVHRHHQVPGRREKQLNVISRPLS
jgi:hypothetical protein